MCQIYVDQSYFKSNIFFKSSGPNPPKKVKVLIRKWV